MDVEAPASTFTQSDAPSAVTVITAEDIRDYVTLAAYRSLRVPLSTSSCHLYPATHSGHFSSTTAQ
ncbi:MAG: hypothetical protein M3495_11875 [Pseudomonadota bacterium]|nr:hypothetical protein [Gammaproteobacteria bacterium]MDQ3582253.1 hypothetical protein [Pseudomonadota bacterium]